MNDRSLAPRVVLVALIGGALASVACGGEAPLTPENEALAAYLAEVDDATTSHHQWHSHVLRGDPEYGLKFLTFHRGLVANYDAWRAQHGYDPLVPWDPGTPIPADLPHPGRLSNDPSAVDPLCRRPAWLTAGGAADDQRDPDFGAAKLTDFASDNQLGRSIDSITWPNWHLRVHETIGGDMATPTRLVKDPIFWRWHKFVDQIWREYETLTATAP